MKLELGGAQSGLDYGVSRPGLDAFAQAMACNDMSGRLQGARSASGFQLLT